MSEQTTDRSRRKVRTGVVVSDGMDKTVMVRIDRQVRHTLYDKTVRVYDMSPKFEAPPAAAAAPAK